MLVSQIIEFLLQAKNKNENMKSYQFDKLKRPSLFYNAQWLMEGQALPTNLRLDANRFTSKMSCYNANGFIWMLSSSVLHCFYFSSTMFDD
ncbi:hypothetical protein J1N35_009612 [Gossypium stocksii]|uniref:Uncharacterized protein n=1 Tax=Gossypium stocksii TaxID=47602 RepID=A0A9D3VYN5_9ROSI|nr:hypothetical protein J1N35_009612 [Gossypium stocksii]